MPKLADLHNHSLFGVDDGAKNMEMTEKMLALSYAEGVRTMCLTPHGDPLRFPYEKETMHSHFAQIKAFCREKFPDLTLYLGNEMFGYIDSARDMKERGYAALGNSNIVLVEFANDADYRNICNVLLSYSAAGYRPMLAHAERCISLVKDVRRIHELVHMRVLIQINASAFRRKLFITPVNSFVFRLMDDDLVDAVASDAHACSTRTPHLLYAYEAVEKRYGEKYANKVFYKNPVRILTGEYGKEHL